MHKEAPAGENGGDKDFNNASTLAGCSVTGAVLIDLRGVAPDAMYRRFFSLTTTPSGALVVVVVGPARVDVRSCELMVRHSSRLNYQILGEPYAVERWVNSVRSGDPLAVEGVLVHE